MSEEERYLLEETRNIINENIDLPGGMEVIKEAMNRVYQYFKAVVNTASFSDERLLEVFMLERLLENKFLPLESEPIYNPDAVINWPRAIRSNEDCEIIMAGIVHETRKHLAVHFDLKNATLEKHCIDTAFDVERICQDLGIKQYRFGCAEDLSRGTFHYFNVVSLPLTNGEVKEYIVDCTYRQFFTYAESFLERLGMPLNSGPNIGAYMLMDERRKKVAEELLTKGYIEFTPENIKCYLDGFVFAGRNGLYYESLGKEYIEKSDYEPEYSHSDYLYALSSGGLKNEQNIGRQFGILNHEIVFDYPSSRGRK